MKVTIYHNPHCSKSRAALALLRGRGIEPEVIEYLQSPPDAKSLRALLKALHIGPRALLRAGQPEYRQNRLDRPQLTDAEIIDVIVRQPVLMERPVVVAGKRAVIGRPPERVLEIL